MSNTFRMLQMQNSFKIALTYLAYLCDEPEKKISS